MFVTDRFRLRAAQKINQITQPETLPSAINRAQGFLRDYRSVKTFKCRVAVVAMPAIFRQFFRKIIEKKFAATGFEVAEPNGNSIITEF